MAVFRPPARMVLARPCRMRWRRISSCWAVTAESSTDVGLAMGAFGTGFGALGFDVQMGHLPGKWQPSRVDALRNDPAILRAIMPSRVFSIYRGPVSQRKIRP